MIKLTNLDSSTPFIIFKNLYDSAISNNQSAIEAIVISSFNNNLEEVESRFVNLKYINESELIFFSNYDGPKGSQFSENPKVSALLYWNSINTQIRIKATIKKTDQDFSDTHFQNRSAEKNALAISSKQSEVIDSYDSVIKNYEKTLNNSQDLFTRPNYWGGYSLKPYYFEFWVGNKSRLNKRDVYKLDSGYWSHSILQP